MKRMPPGRHVPGRSSRAAARTVRRVRRGVTLAAVVAACAAIFPATQAGAAPAAPTTHPGLKAILAEANALSEQIDQLSEQYDGHKIQLAQARSTAAIAT